MGEYQNSEKVFSETKPPKAVDILSMIFDKYRKRSEIIPLRPYDAAHWWMDHQEPANEMTERVERVVDKTGKVGWQTPYIDRIAATLRIFLSMNPAQQIFIIEKVQHGIPWRGDSMAFYLEVIRQTDIRDKYVEALGRDADGLLPREYTSEIMKAAHELAMKMTGGLICK